MYFKEPGEIFSYVCHIIFAVIIAISYESATNILINSEKPLLSNMLYYGVWMLELLLAYLMLVSGWINYGRSMMVWQYSDGKLGTSRFILDLIILFCYFGLIVSAGQEQELGNYFLIWFVILFVLFTVWDYIKIAEEKRSNKKQKKSEKIFTVSFFYLILIIISIVFIFLMWTEYNILIIDEPYYPFILIFIIIFVLSYRYLKWPIPLNKESK
jgi:hypothetical protein